MVWPNVTHSSHECVGRARACSPLPPSPAPTPPGRVPTAAPVLPRGPQTPSSARGQHTPTTAPRPEPPWWPRFPHKAPIEQLHTTISCSCLQHEAAGTVCWPRCPAHGVGANPRRYHQQTARGKIISDKKSQSNVAKSTARAVTSLLCAAPQPLGSTVGGQPPLRAPAASSLPAPSPVGSGSISSCRLGSTLPRRSRW